MALLTLSTACVAASEDGLRERDDKAQALRVGDAEPAGASDAAEPPFEACALREAVNQEWFKQWQTCESDEDCTVVKLAAGCLAPFACPVGLSVHADRTQLELDALERAASFMQDCGCAEVRCATRTSKRAVCDRKVKLCRPRTQS